MVESHIVVLWQTVSQWFSGSIAKTQNIVISCFFTQVIVNQALLQVYENVHQCDSAVHSITLRKIPLRRNMKTGIFWPKTNYHSSTIEPGALELAQCEVLWPHTEAGWRWCCDNDSPCRINSIENWMNLWNGYSHRRGLTSYKPLSPCLVHWCMSSNHEESNASDGGLDEKSKNFIFSYSSDQLHLTSIRMT